MGKFTASFFALVLASTVAAAPTLGQQDQTGQSDTDTTSLEIQRITDEDPGPEQMVRQVLTQMHQGNQLEIRLGQLAQEKGQWENVREFGDRMVRDHRTGDERAMALAEERGVRIQSRVAGAGVDRSSGQAESRTRARRAERPDTVQRDARGGSGGRAVAGSGSQPDPQQMARRLEQASPEEFDRMYLNAMVTMHENTIQELSQARQRAQDPELLDLLENLLPILQQHHRLAVALREDLGERGPS